MKRTALRSNAATLREWERRTREKRKERERQVPSLRRRRGLGAVVEPKRAPRPDRREDVAYHEALAEVEARSGGLCEANWEGVCAPGPHRAQHKHHVILRSHGGPDVAWNLLHLCAVVHQHAHDVDRAGAEKRGIIRRSKAR